MTELLIDKDNTFVKTFEKLLKNEGPFSNWELFKLTYQSELTRMVPSFQGLHALDYLPHMQFLPHQIKTATTAIEQMNGRVILADEVGLGKTIEAGLILKEYMIRNLVKKVLILVPASLVNQWVKELNEKFFIPAIAFRKNMHWEQYDIIVSSLDLAKRSPHQEMIQQIDYDFLLVDEAHKLKNHRTKNYSFIRSVHKKYCLLLTATPIQNNLLEIFNLVSILKPGHLGDYDSFMKRFGKDRQLLAKDQYLKKLVQQVMIRNTRKETSLNNINRQIHTIWLDFSKEQLACYQTIQQLKDLPTFSKITFLREFCSSREACYMSLKKLLSSVQNNEQIEKIITTIEQLPQHVKAEKVVELIKSLGNEKVIIFTEYRASQYFLQHFLHEHGISSVPFRGGFKASKKDWMRQIFENQAQVLIATEAGGEGINLQFCHHLVNYDLPWNPMKLEQRIGRIHRFGQQHPVHVYNFAIRHTIEEHMMKLLYEKINLFEKVIGELDDILADLNIQDFESEIKNIFAESSSEGEIKIKLNNLTAIINQEQIERNHKEAYHENY